MQTAGRQGTRSAGASHCRRKFLRYFKKGFADETFFEWERGYKERGHQQWLALLCKSEFSALLSSRQYTEIAARAVRIESRTNLLFSFEKMALRDAVKSTAGATVFSKALYAFLHGEGSEKERFEQWCAAVERLPRRQTRVLTWPVVTVWGFLAQPGRHIFFKPSVTRRAAEAYGIPLEYQSRPQWEVYHSLLRFAGIVRQDLRDLHPRDLIDIQSFLWVQGSDEYPD